MKALVTNSFGPEPQMQIETRAIPETKPGYSLIKMHAATVNPLSNLIRLGELPLAEAPLVLSNDGAGIVARSDLFPAGTLVALYGGGQCGITEDGFQQQWVLVENKRLMPLPADYPPEAAAALPVNYITACQAVNRLGKVKPGDRVVINGASGSVGHALIQTAILAGAEVMAVVSSDAKVAYARQAGAQHVINLSMQDLKKTILSLTNNQGADVAFDQVGGEQLPALLSAVRPRGTVVSIGFIGGTEGKIDIPDMVIHEKKLLGYDTWMESDEEIAIAMKAVQRHVAEGHLQPRIDSVWPMDNYAEAYHRLSSRQAAGTVLLKLNDDGGSK